MTRLRRAADALLSGFELLLITLLIGVMFLAEALHRLIVGRPE